MVSYKKLYEDLKKSVEDSNKPVKSNYLCPKCNNILMDASSEIYCLNEDCTFDYTPDEIIAIWAENRNLEWR